MTAFPINLIAIMLYIAAALYFGDQFLRQQVIHPRRILCAAGVALITHGAGLWLLGVQDDSFNFSVFTASSLIFWVINSIVLLSSLKKAVHNLFLLLFPLSALSLLVSISTHYNDWQYTLNYEIATHVVLSILAYSLLTIASLQALFLTYQNHALKTKQLSNRTRLLPPLQTMESLLFEFLWAGEILLTLAIISGFYFLEDMFAQHLAHKTIFALVAWSIYALLLWGRHQLGWRGTTAIRWTLAGFICLMLAYFGSKLVLEIILHRA